MIRIRLSLVMGIFAAAPAMLSVTPATAQETPKNLQLRIPADRNWIFDAEHPARFALELNSPKPGIAGELQIDIRTDFGEPIASRKAAYAFTVDSATVKGGFRSRVNAEIGVLSPGFYQAYFIAGADTLRHIFFGYEPERIVSEPDGKADLKKFWRKTLAELKGVAPDYRMTPLADASTPERAVYEVQMQSLEGETLRGYWAVPEDGRKHPAVVVYQGYGATTWIPKPTDYPGWCVLVIPPRGQGLNKTWNRFGEWISYGLDSPWHYYYRGAFADTVRSIDFVFAQSGFDGRNLFATGISQGGGLTLVAASLDRRVRAAAPIVPFLGDFPDYFRLVPWPASLVFEGAEKQHVTREAVFNLLSYFDLKNLCRRIECPVLMGFGLQDVITPPHTNFAAYNPIRAPKRWICYPESGHYAAYDNMDIWIAESTRFFHTPMKTSNR